MDTRGVAPQDNELLAQQGILGDELTLAARQVGQGGYDQTRGRGRGDRFEATLDGLHEATTEATKAVDQRSNHQAAP
jgi:hypothetical protein